MTVLLQISALFILMAAGFALGKRKVLDTPSIRGMSNLIVKATLPALIVMSLQKPFSKALLGDSLRALVLASVFYLLIIALSLAAARLLRVESGKAGALAFALSFSNAAFIGFPVITSILGDGALFLTSIHNIIFNILAFTVGIIIVGGRSAKGGGRVRIPLKNIFNVNVIAAIAGFILFIASITIPRVLSLPLTMLGGLTTPLAMIVTGAQLSRIALRPVFGDWKLYAVCALRLAVWPLVTAVVLTLLGVTGELKYITIIISGMPSASNTSLLAEVYGGDTGTASSIVCLTTLFSVVSIPLLAMALG